MSPGEPIGPWAAGYDLIILGAGAAGLAAAVKAVDLGLRPLVLESAPAAGGRARSFFAPVLGEEVDNGPHLLVGACRQTVALLKRIGSRGLLRRPPAVDYTFWSEAHGLHRLACPDWPSPWHLLAGLRRMPGMTWHEVMDAVTMGWSCLFPPAGLESMSVTQWLLDRGQSPALLQRFWYPLCLSLLNEPPASANALVFATVLEEMFFAGRRAAAPLYITGPLSDLLARPAVAAIEEGGGKVLFGCRVVGLAGDGERLTAVHTSWGTLARPGRVICALPLRVTRRLLADWSTALGWGTLEHAPIVSVHLSFASRVPLPAPMVGVPELASQWLLERSTEHGSGFSAVISAAYREVHWSTSQLARTVHQDLARVVPALAQESPRAALVVKERFATLATWPGITHHRGSVTTCWRNLWLAGDWTDTGLPATLEGAIRSGHQAALLAHGVEREGRS